MSSLPAKNKENLIKNDGARVFTRFLPLSVSDFSRRSWAVTSAVHGRIWSNFVLVRDFIVVLITCKNEEDPIKNEGARVATREYDDFSGAQEQIIPKSLVESGRNSISFKFKCTCSLPARMKKIQ